MELHFQYLDGNNNRWRLDGQKLSYEPVSTQNSSSGFYNGGDAYQSSLSAEELLVCQTHLEALLKACPPMHLARQMGQGLLIYQGLELLVDHAWAEKNTWERFLRSFE